jgi:hypothetical protein
MLYIAATPQVVSIVLVVEWEEKEKFMEFNVQYTSLVKFCLHPSNATRIIRN